ncbi:hypothetical protein HY409_03275 [Candidatus Gottesmanbacteria bacterium]|nr:hypothetical protein [Candidatus Gottesmanbacteria bacterium]
MTNLIECAINNINRFQDWRRERKIGQDPAAIFVLGEYRDHGGVILGMEGDPYRLKVTPDGMEIIPQDEGELARTNPQAEKSRIQDWIRVYGIQAMFTQRYLRVALGLPPDLPNESKSSGPETR